MFGMAMNSAKLFFAGKLFKENKTVMKQMMLGAGLGVVVGVIVGLFTSIWIGALAAGIVSGLVQPVLFKDLKYA
jgi:hypothetical protein